MRLIRNVRGISRLWLIFLLLSALVIGALMSYLWVMGWYVTLRVRPPGTTVVDVESVGFNPQNTTSFNVTLLHPSFSRSDYAFVTRLLVLTRDGVVDDLDVEPSLPYKLPVTENKTFEVRWNWANYTGENIGVVVFVVDGSGATFQAQTPFVNLVVDANFNSTISVNRFNMSILNSELSATDVNVTSVAINGETVPPQNLTINGEPISFPYALPRNESLSFTCLWNWTNYQGRNVTIAVQTLQGYVRYYTPPTLPPPVILEVAGILFDPADPTHFGVTVRNGEESPTRVDITKISVTMENGTTREITEASPTLTSPFTLHPNSSETFVCSWDWTNYQGRNITITVYTLQGFVAYGNQTTPVLLELKETYFSPDNMTRFYAAVLKNASLNTVKCRKSP